MISPGASLGQGGARNGLIVELNRLCNVACGVEFVIRDLDESIGDRNQAPMSYEFPSWLKPWRIWTFFSNISIPSVMLDGTALPPRCSFEAIDL